MTFKMHALSGGRLRMRKSTYLPDADRQEAIELPVSCFLLRHAQGNVLFDTGCHPSTAEDAASRWGGMAKFMVPVSTPADNLITQLDTVGLKPPDIDVVISSHFHSDHCGCNEFFRRATIFCHLLELEAASAADGPDKSYLPVDWRQPMPVRTIEGQHDLFGDGRIVMLPLPGHTPGMTGALVNLDRGINPRNTWNAEQSTRSMDEVRRIEASGATVLFGHDDEQWQQLRKGPQAYE